MKFKIDMDDIMVVFGGLMVGTGIWFIYWPAALIVMGLVFLFLGIRGSKIKRSK